MKISHLGIAVRDLKNAEELFSKLLGDSRVHHEEVADQKVRIASFDVNGTMIELTAPTTSDSPISKFLEKRGEGIHHIALEVEDVAKEIARLKGEGFQMIDEAPRVGSHGMLIAFLHPKSTDGVLIELCQQPSTKSDVAPASSPVPSTPNTGEDAGATSA
ncbi:MAG TPA: methylmalonyl-CoA epimerase [Candidatus Kapabacteria bacterium]|nr:methylmalonyl-CoA epimerase [Candidatus Kapabacteria bacterium]